MTDFENPASWVVPDWHPDFGNVREELEHLRTLAIEMCKVIGGASVALELPEPGVMYLATEQHNKNAEVYSVPADEGEQRRYAVFLFPGSSAEQEYYFKFAPEVVRFLNAEKTNTIS